MKVNVVLNLGSKSNAQVLIDAAHFTNRGIPPAIGIIAVSRIEGNRRVFNNIGR